MSFSAPRTVLLLLLVLFVSACATRRADPATDDPPTSVRVMNQSWFDTRIFVVASGQRIRLGTVTASSTATLRIPASVVGLGRDVSFLADPVGTRTVASSFSIFVRPGEEVTITIPPQVR